MDTTTDRPNVNIHFPSAADFAAGNRDRTYILTLDDHPDLYPDARKLARPVNFLLDVGADAAPLRVKAATRDGSPYYTIEQNKRTTILTLGRIEHDVAIGALIGARVLASFGGVDGVPSLNALELGQAEAPIKHPDLPPRAALDAVRAEQAALLVNVANIAVRWAGQNTPAPVPSGDAQWVSRQFVVALGKALSGETAAPKDFRRMTVAEYHRDEFWPKRIGAIKGTRQEEQIWRTVLLPALGTVPLAQLDAPGFERLISSMTLADGSPASGAYKRAVRVAYAALLTHAGRLGHRGPPHEFYSIKGSTKKVLAKDTFTLAEFRKILGKSSVYHRALFATAAGEGLRPSEVCSLRWENVDFQKNTLRVEGTKTAGAAATIPLTSIALEHLRPWFLLCGQPPTGWVFPFRGAKIKRIENWTYSPADPPVNCTSDGAAASTFKTALRNATKKAGLGHLRITPYTLRSMFATWALEAGVSAGDVRRVMRHTNEEMIRKHYDRTQPADVVNVDALNAAFMPTPEPEPQPENVYRMPQRA